MFFILILLIESCSLLPGNKSECHKREGFIEPEDQCVFNSKVNYFRGIWYGQTKLEKGGYKYAGGLGTYTNYHSSSAVYHQDSDKTFFTYGGTKLGYKFENSRNIGPDQLYIMISSYNHRTGTLEKPTLVFDKWTNDPHDNPGLDIGPQGHILLFAPSHGHLTTPSYILKSKYPASIDSFEVIEKSLFAYPQSHMDKNGDGVFFYTSYQNGRTLKFRQFIGGRLQKKENMLSSIQAGHYLITSMTKSKIGSAFNFIPRPEGSDYRTNLYYLETLDNGNSWQNVNGNEVLLPVTNINNPTLIKDYRKEGKLVYIMDISFDSDLNPIILYNISSNPFPDLDDTNRVMMVAFYKEQKWNFQPISTTDHNYNMGSLKITDLEWAVIAPTTPGPQKIAAGGELDYWASNDKGFTWKFKRRLTENSLFNHNFVKRVRNARPEFSFVWADGNAIAPSESRLYYSDDKGLKTTMME